MDYTLETPTVVHGEAPTIDSEPTVSNVSCTEENIVLVELVCTDPTSTLLPLQPLVAEAQSKPSSCNLAEESIDTRSTPVVTPVPESSINTQNLLYRILNPSVEFSENNSHNGTEQFALNRTDSEERDDASSPCPSVTTEAAVYSDSSCSDTGTATEKKVHVRPYFISRALQTRPQVRSQSVQAGRPLRKRKLSSSVSEKCQTTAQTFEENLPIASSVELPPPVKRHIVSRKRKSRTVGTRKKRTLDFDQCLEDVYDRLPESRKSEIIPLCGYDRVSSICRDTFQNKEDWLQEGLPKCFEICALVAQPVRLVIWLARRRLIRNRTACPQCPNPMLLRTAMVDRHIYKWACRRCGRKLSIRHGSMFIKAGVSDPNIVLILYLWSVGYPTDFLGTEIETSLSSVRWYVWLALKSCAAELRREFTPLQGVVELHWDSFLRPTHKREGLNLLCGVERNSGKVFAVRCPRGNDKSLLRRLIQTNIAPGSSIITRDIPVYTQLNLQAMGYMHYVLDREHELALDDLMIDLSQVEDFVNSIKSFLRKQGGPGLFCKEIFLAEIIVRRTWGKNLLPMVLYSISQAYDIS